MFSHIMTRYVTFLWIYFLLLLLWIIIIIIIVRDDKLYCEIFYIKEMAGRVMWWWRRVPYRVNGSFILLWHCVFYVSKRLVNNSLRELLMHLSLSYPSCQKFYIKSPLMQMELTDQMCLSHEIRLWNFCFTYFRFCCDNDSKNMHFFLCLDEIYDASGIA